MLSSKKHLVPDAEVKVQKVKKNEPVRYNGLVTRPLVYGTPKMVTVKEKKPPVAAYAVVPSTKKIERKSAQDIEGWIMDTKKKFVREDNN